MRSTRDLQVSRQHTIQSEGCFMFENQSQRRRRDHVLLQLFKPRESRKVGEKKKNAYLFIYLFKFTFSPLHQNQCLLIDNKMPTYFIFFVYY